jgi:thiol-disulfide isomerase/thioredoxin
MEMFVLFRSKQFILLPLFLLSIYSSSSLAEKAPSFTLDGDNGSISLKQFRGKVVYIDFWASWCVPCRKSFPWMNAMQAKYKSEGFVVLGVNLDEDKQAAKKFLQQIPAKFTIAYDPDGETPGKYQVAVMPTSYLIDRSGNIVDSHRGFKKSQTDEMEHKISTLLRKK